jgi:hypothetical protein
MFEIKAIKDISRERINELAENTAKAFGGSILPIYGSTQGGFPEHIGSCIALSLNGRPHLLTAAHVLDLNEQTSLYVGHENLHLLEMEFRATAKPNGHRRNDRLDFALGELPESDFKCLDGVNFLTEDQIDLGEGSAAGQMYTSIGYPNSKNKKIDHAQKHIKAKRFLHTGIAKFDNESAQTTGTSLTEHILISHNSKYSKDDSGRQVSSVALYGMSGGAVINIGNLADPEVLAGSIEPVPLLAGLFIEYHKKPGIIVATKLGTILGATKTLL